MGTKISELSEATSILDDDVLPIVNNGVTKKAKVSTILKENSFLVKITADTAKGATVTLPKNYKNRSWRFRCLLQRRKIDIEF